MRKIFLIIFIVLLLISCDDDNSNIEVEYSTEKVDELKNVVKEDGLSLLLDELLEGEYKVIESTKLDTPHQILKGDATDLKLDKGPKITIYSYNDAKLLYDGIYSIHNNGYSFDVIENGKIVGRIEISWNEQPHFYLFKNIIILYVSHDKKFITFLDNIAHEKITK